MKKWEAYKYQQFGVKHLIKHPNSGLFLDMGLGKTSITLTAIDDLKNCRLMVTRPLIIGPKRVIENVWTGEVNTWEHLKHLKISIVTGTHRQRIRALSTKADMYAISRDNVAWLVNFYSINRWPFDMLIVDESSSFKDPSSERFKALKKVLPYVDRTIILSGTPAPNSLMDLWPQLFLLDRGERLFDTITNYRDEYFSQKRQENYTTYKIIKGADKIIHEKISDICVSMQAKDYLQLPPVIDRVTEIEFDKKTMQKYKDFVRDKIMELGSADITAVNAGVLNNKLLQFTNGAVYDEFKDIHHIHNYKLDALEELVECLNGNPVLIFYWFKHDLQRIMQRLKKYKPILIKTPESIKKWNDRKAPVALLHPAGAGHGLNLQFGGNQSIWYSPIYSNELTNQANARILRPGQKSTVIRHHLRIKGTIEAKVVQALIEKRDGENALLSALRAAVKEIRK